MPDGSVPLLVALILLVLTSGFFSSAETSYSCCSKIRLRALSSNGNRRAEKVLVLAEEKYDKFISTILIGNNIVNLTAATIATLFFSKIIRGGTVNPSVISTIVITVAVLIFGEMTPKFIAKTYPEKLSMAFYPAVIFFYWIFYPLNLLFGGWKWLVSKVFRLKNDDVITEEEIMTVVEEAEEDGTLKKEETNLIRSVIEFDDLEVGDILVPRVNMVAMDISADMEDFKKAFDSEGYSRLPVYKDSIDTIIGTVHEKDFFNAYLAGKKSVDGILQNAYYTTEHAKISALLKDLQKKKTHMAIVLDEYGGTLGLVTMEDVLEELVGEIWDEHDEEITYYKKLNDNTYSVDGNAPVHDIFDIIGAEYREEEFDAVTVSGWVIEKLGEIPRVGVTFDYENLQIEVLKATVKRVLQIKITVKEQKEN